ncbi:hypothetical protein QUF18_03855 [Pseudochrobactrum kiredjianiae]|nr:hypothetical protein [Pseudochrobactrum kiredjianiae]
MDVAHIVAQAAETHSVIFNCRQYASRHFHQPYYGSFMQNNPQPFALIGYIIAAALLLPLGWWLKEERLFGFGDWVVSLFY